MDWSLFDDQPPYSREITVLCGSTKFGAAFDEANLCETLQGRVVLSIGSVMHSDDGLKLPDKTRDYLNRLHLYKVRIADRVLVLNVGGYIGESTFREVIYALHLGKRIYFWEPVDREALLERISEETALGGPHLMLRNAWQSLYHGTLRIYLHG